jgi:hypothetical protein
MEPGRRDPARGDNRRNHQDFSREKEMQRLQNIKAVNVTSPRVINDNTAYSTATLDTMGFDEALFIVQLGATRYRRRGVEAAGVGRLRDVRCCRCLRCGDFSVSPATLAVCHGGRHFHRHSRKARRLRGNATSTFRLRRATVRPARTRVCLSSFRRPKPIRVPQPIADSGSCSPSDRRVIRQRHNRWRVIPPAFP